MLAATLAQATERMRVGSGGVMLPNHAPLVVAEQFGMLEALHPGRIDLGIGRAPGTDGHTAMALRRQPDALSDDDFPRHLAELFAFFNGEFPPEHPYAGITAVPGKGDKPDIWLLGSSGYSAQLAGMLGLPFSFAHHFMAQNTLPALELYRSELPPVGSPLRAARDGRRRRDPRRGRQARPLPGGPLADGDGAASPGQPDPLPDPETAAGHAYSPAEESAVKQFAGSAVIGGPETVREGLDDLAEKTAADELMITTMVYDQADRIRSYEGLAEMFELSSEPR